MGSHFSQDLFKRLLSWAEILIVSHYNALPKRILIALYYSTGNAVFLFLPFMQLVMNFHEETMKTLAVFIAVVTLFWKYSSIALNIRKLSDLANLIHKLDLEVQQPELKDYLCKRIRFGSQLCRAYVVVSISTCLAAIFSALLTGKLLFPMWIPFDWQNSRLIYWTVLCCALLSYACIAFEDLLGDLVRIIYILIIPGHLYVLGERVSRIGYDQFKSNRENYEELIGCVRTHQMIIRYLDRIFNLVTYYIQKSKSSEISIESQRR